MVDWTNGREEDTDDHSASLTVDCSSTASPLRGKSPPLLQLSPVILQHPCLSTPGSSRPPREVRALPAEPAPLTALSHGCGPASHPGTDRKNVSASPEEERGKHFITGSAGDNGGRRRSIIHGAAGASDLPRRSLQRPVSEVTSKRQGLGGSRRPRRRRGNSQVPQQGSLLWRQREGSGEVTWQHRSTL